MNRIQVEIPRERIADFCRTWRIVELSLFGSTLREDFQPESDVDLLVTFAPEADWRYWDLLTMQDELEKLLGRKVDLVERKLVEASENWIRRKHILENAEPIYVAG